MWLELFSESFCTVFISDFISDFMLGLVFVLAGFPGLAFVLGLVELISVCS